MDKPRNYSNISHKPGQKPYSDGNSITLGPNIYVLTEKSKETDRLKTEEMWRPFMLLMILLRGSGGFVYVRLALAKKVYLSTYATKLGLCYALHRVQHKYPMKSTWRVSSCAVREDIKLYAMWINPTAILGINQDKDISTFDMGISTCPPPEG